MLGIPSFLPFLLLVFLCFLFDCSCSQILCPFFFTKVLELFSTISRLIWGVPASLGLMSIIIASLNPSADEGLLSTDRSQDACSSCTESFTLVLLSASSTLTDIDNVIEFGGSLALL